MRTKICNSCPKPPGNRCSIRSFNGLQSRPGKNRGYFHKLTGHVDCTGSRFCVSRGALRSDARDRDICRNVHTCRRESGQLFGFNVDDTWRLGSHRCLWRGLEGLIWPRFVYQTLWFWLHLPQCFRSIVQFRFRSDE